MRKVINVNLNGNAYQLDEDAYGLLAAYLDRAEAQLKDNPDRAEIVADLEQAIAEKCGRFLGPRKTVVAAGELRQIIDELGPVDDGAGETGPSGPGGTRAKTESGAGAAKRLYQIRQGAMISGVCNGLAAFFGIDVTVVRLAFVALAILTGGAWILVYAIMMFVVPFAETSEQRAAAYGLSFNAQELIDRAKKNYAELKDRRQWKWHWKMQRRQWREWRRVMQEQSRWWASNLPRGPWYPGDALAAVLTPVFGLLELAFFVLLAFAIYSLVATGAILGWRPPAEIPLWAGILILVALYAGLVSPLSAARHAWYYGYRGRLQPQLGVWNEIVPLAGAVFLIWLGYLYIPAVHSSVAQLLGALHHLLQRLRATS